ncbi:spore protease YyaC [Halalkalibacterium ligniniphilum]|uniref:spore protease YyaC n=1 Tax=Halalkalibacterium ligniniphilum TaxID=1134413 RepID=UPI00034C936A|nr:spore protease YyaC [Halalkalibacterium ligniniphilum]
MNGNNRLFSKKRPPFRIHMDEPDVQSLLAEELVQYFHSYEHRELVVICIGTDRSTGDALGPLVGSKLEEASLGRFHVYGTLSNPIHAVNLEERFSAILQTYRRPYVLAIDACLGRLNSVGKVVLADGPVQPGAAVNKKLPPVGDIHMTGIVNIAGMMEYFMLQNTRLHTVMQLAEIIAGSIQKVDQQLPNDKPVHPLLHTLKPQLLFRAKKETHP